METIFPKIVIINQNTNHNLPFKIGRICGKSTTDSILRDDAAKKKSKRPEIADTSAAKLHSNMVFPQMRPTAEK